MSSRVSRAAFLWVGLAALVAAGVVVFLFSPLCCGTKDATLPPAPKLPADFAFKSTAIDLPADDSAFPPGPNVEAMAGCAACHSPSMITNQPRLKPEQWAATVKKMREVYKAPIAEADVPKILAYLDTLSGAQPAIVRTAR